ncbi:hypothetical protein M758_UG197100, partial [Ceratodon purpureus]
MNSVLVFCMNTDRPYWRCYYPNTQAIIYVVDSSDTERLSIAQEEFHATLQEEELKDAIILIYAYKHDLPGALDAAVVTEALNLHVIKNRQWSIFKTSAIKGDGLFEGLDWYDFVPLIRLPFWRSYKLFHFMDCSQLLFRKGPLASLMKI